jgi:hypothetical protein
MTRAEGSITVTKYKTQWVNYGCSNQRPDSLFCITHHTPPPYKTTFKPDEHVVVFGFLQWQDSTGTWRSDWPYQVKATLGVTGPETKYATVNVGLGKGEAWADLGTLKPGSYTFYLDFAGDDRFEDGAVQAAILVSAEEGVWAWLQENWVPIAVAGGLASVLVVGGVVAYQSLQKK